MERKDVAFPPLETCWLPWKPTADDPWDASKAAHLHRRAGLCGTWTQVRRDAAEGFQPSVRRVLEGETQGPDGRSTAEFAEVVDAMVESARRDPSIERIQYLWLFHLIYTPHALAERMTLAWHSHYATSHEKVRDPVWMLDQNLALRELWRAPMSRLHGRMLRDPAMQRWLDGLDSRKEEPNENLGREFLECFALGEGHYAEVDVRAAARALTGWQSPSNRAGGITFDEERHDDGMKTVLGDTGPWGLDDLVRIACARPEAAVHIARRLFRTFIADAVEPPPGVVEALAETMRVAGDIDVASGIERILRSRLFFSPWCRGKRVKSPVELVIGAVRGCERFDPPPDFVALEGALVRMGQRLFYPPSVAGWPDGLAWLRGPTLLARGEFAARFASGPPPRAGEPELETLLLGPLRSRTPTPGRHPAAFLRDLLGSSEAQLA